MIGDRSRLSQFVMKPTFSGSKKPLIHGLKFLLHVKHLAVFVFLLDLIHTIWLTLFRTFDIFCQITWFITLQEVKTPSCCSCLEGVGGICPQTYGFYHLRLTVTDLLVY